MGGLVVSRGPWNSLLRPILMVALGALAAGCGADFSESGGPPLPGERISVLEFENVLEPDPEVADLQVVLPPAIVNDRWPQAGGYPNHAMHHLALGNDLKRAWTADIGAAASSETRQLAAPIAVGNRVFAIDPKSTISAFDAETGKLIWRQSFVPDGEEPGEIGGGLAFKDGILYVSTGYGRVYAVEPDNGAEVWQADVKLPIRAAPTVMGDRVFVVTYDNQLHALSTANGIQAWTHVGIVESAGLIAAANPAADGNVLVAPYSSGELFAFRADNGRIAWSDSLTRRRSVPGIGDIRDISGHPVIDRGRVYAISNGGMMVSIDLRSGERVWERAITGSDTIWVAGDFLFLLTSESEVVCLTRERGQIRWVQRLPRFVDPNDKSERILWSGPVLAGEQLFLVSDQREMAVLSPFTGEIVKTVKLPAPARLAPVVADATLYLVTETGKLTAWR